MTRIIRKTAEAAPRTHVADQMCCVESVETEIHTVLAAVASDLPRSSRETALLRRLFSCPRQQRVTPIVLTTPTSRKPLTVKHWEVNEPSETTASPDCTGGILRRCLPAAAGTLPARVSCGRSLVCAKEGRGQAPGQQDARAPGRQRLCAVQWARRQSHQPHRSLC